MRLPKVYINGYLIDLAPSTVIASTFQAVNIGDPTSRKANYTNRLKGLLTPNNIKALGFSNILESTSTIPWSALDAKVVDGMEIMQNATALVRGAGDGFDIEIYSGNFDFYSRLGEKTLEDLSCDNTSEDLIVGSVASNPTIDQAYVNTVTGVNEAANPLPDARQTMLIYKRVIEKIISGAGYLATDANTVATLADAKLALLRIFPIGDRGFYNKSFTSEKEFFARRTGTSMTVAAAWTTIDFATTVKASPYWNSLNTYTCTKPQAAFAGDWYQQKFCIRINITAAATFQIRVRNITTGTDYINTTVGSAGAYLLTFPSALFNAKNGEQVVLQMQTGLGVPNTLNYDDFAFWNEVSNVNPSTTYFNAKGLLPPSIKQKDFFKEFCVRFGVLIDEQSQPGVLICKTISNVIKDKAHAKDWTTKRDASVNDQINFAVESAYGQNSYFKYPKDDELTAENLGRGNMQISNVNLEPSKDIYESIFYASFSTVFGNGGGGFINKVAKFVWVAGDDVKPRLLMRRITTALEPTITGGITGGNYYVAYFLDDSQTYDCDFQKFIDSNYAELKLSLQNAKTVMRKYRLSQIDIAGLNLLVPIYDKGSYFLINKISNYVPDKVTGVELFKII
jgi:hypothetical protein